MASGLAWLVRYKGKNNDGKGRRLPAMSVESDYQAFRSTCIGISAACRAYYDICLEEQGRGGA
ncbi:hypothetical protein CEF21_18930 [Bacillus sp. FJAT-42376]|nr:hypothetical protein CEF21_18930 [Bacillus sp. FJAT-42376]